MIRWFAKNDLAANLLMIGILVAGGIIAFTKIPLEVRPTREFPVIKVNIPYRGATPQEIERQIVIPVEQALQGLAGVDVIESNCHNGVGQVNVYMLSLIHI